MKATFDHTVSILVKAYLNDTLEHGNDCACAVGNLICAAKGFNPKSNWHPRWHQFFKCKWSGDDGFNEACDEVASTGYSVKEILLIEYAFENADYGDDEDLNMFNGLMAVVDVLAEIHNVDLTVKEQAKKLFKPECA